MLGVLSTLGPFLSEELLRGGLIGIFNSTRRWNVFLLKTHALRLSQRPERVMKKVTLEGTSKLIGL